ERQKYIEKKQVLGEEKRQLTADEMSEFYKNFLDKHWETHLRYNFEWYTRNFALLFLAFRWPSVIMSDYKFLLLFAIFGVAFAVQSENISNVVNEEVHSKVDLKNQLVHVKDLIVFRNVENTTLRKYLYAINEPQLHYVTFYNKVIEKLSYKKLNNASEPALFEITLDVDIMPNQTYTMFTKITYANKIVPATKSRKMRDNQLMKFEGNIKFFSPYETMLFKIEYFLPNNSLVETTREPSELLTDKVIFLFQNIEKYSIDRVELIFVNNNAFLVIENLERIIDVNHFGKIFLEDKVTILNNGPKFIGPYVHNLQYNKKGATTWMYTHLPTSAENIKFFDNIGNSSQTRIYHFINYITLKFRTRFPILGGWKSYYILRYDVPTHEYLFVTMKNHYLLQIRGIDYVLNDKVIQHSVVKIVLPEGAQIEKVYVPKGLSVSNEETSCLDGLCVFGRPMIVLKGNNLFENHITTIRVEYFFDWLYLLRAPLVISFYLQMFFFVVFFG
ncbi:dolichyl-diphosphooligosaccharide--protein glycosyltransferase subunit 1-like, partial [Asbolus verrucosus]